MALKACVHKKESNGLNPRMDLQMPYICKKGVIFGSKHINLVFLIYFIFGSYNNIK